jgi:hypothetical protein
MRAALAGLLIWPIASFAPIHSHAAAPPAMVATLAIRPELLQDGDLIFRRGRDLMAASVLAADDAARFSHVGLIVRDGDKVWVIHAVPAEGEADGGVVREGLAGFLDHDKAADFAIYRHQTLTPEQRQIVRQAAIGVIGTPFDYDLQLSDAGALYCTELVLRAYAAALAPFPEGVRRVQTVLMQEPAVTPDGLRAAPVLAEVALPG